jgi:hypothetical protein
MRRLLLFLLCSLPSAAHDGQADLPKHGGIVFTSGFLDVEFVLLKPKGRYGVYFSGASGEELPASTVSDVTISIRRSTGAAQNLALRIDDSGESWTGSGSSGEAPIAGARVSYKFHGKTEQADVPFATVYHAEFRATPEAVRAGAPVQLSFTVRDFFGKNVRALQIVHEKPMHLMIVSRDLAEFYHIHPEPAQGGVFRVSHIFPHGGDYRLFADFTPLGAGARIEPFDLKVQGAPRAAIALASDAGSNNAVGGVRMALSADKPLRAGQDIGLSMALVDAKTGAPIRNLQRYLGAWAHIAIVSQDLQDFIHVHPIEEAQSPSTIHTSAGFRRPGLYKMWVQVQRQDQVVAVPFVLRVADGAVSGAPVSQAPSGATLIKVGSGGYEPARIKAKAGQPMKLAFFRADAQNCGRMVKFPALGIERELPPGQLVVIDVTPRKSGSLAFACGMGMMHGELLVQ